MSLLIALLLLQSSPDVVVTAQRLKAAQQRCERQQCSTLEDARVSIATAESYFRDGRYLDAKRLLARALSRNKAAAAVAPRPVAAIYEAYATVALHEGDLRAYRRGVAGQVHTLRDHLPADDPAVASAGPALGDMWVKLGKYVEADGVYAAAQRAATAAGQDRAALLVGFRRIGVASALGGPSRATRLLDQLDANPVAAEPEMRKVLRVLRLQVAARQADEATMKALAREIAIDQADKPVLLWSRPFEDVSVGSINRENLRFSPATTFPDRSEDITPVQWLDVGFWIRPDGRTDQAEVLRSSGSLLWKPAILAQIATRQYAALSVSAGADPHLGGIYRIERISKRLEYRTPLKSLIPRRLPASGFEVINLTEGDARVANAERTDRMPGMP